MSPAGSPAAIDERLARLAPTTSPDPERLDAARAALDAVVDGTDDGTGPSRSRRVGGAHVLDLDEARARHDDGDGVPVPLLDDDVVVPLGRGRTARERRRSRVQLGAAAAGVVGIVAVGLVLAPRPAPGPASPLDSCAANLTASAVPDGFDLDPDWRTLVHQSRDGADLLLLRSDETGLTGFCANSAGPGGTTMSTTLWTEDPPTDPAVDAVVPGAVQDDEWYVAWGVAGSDVRSVRLLAEWSDEGRTKEAGLTVEPRQPQGGLWSVFVPGREIPPDAETSLVWQLADGSERSMSLDSAWPEAGAPTTPLVDARRDACVPGGAAALRPVIEKRYGAEGLTVFADDEDRFIACLQDAVPPYGASTTLSGSSPEDAPGAGEAKALLSGGSVDGRVMLGRFGGDVASVEVLSTNGSSLEADLRDGYWAVWASGLDEDAWDDARLVWYLDDGSRHESPVFS